MSEEVTEKEIKIKKASLKDDTVEIEFEEIIEGENGPVINTMKMKGGNTPHKDLKEAIASLNYHAAILCEQCENQNDDLVEQIKCTGFSIGGSDEHEGVTLIAYRNLSNGKVLNLIAPFTKWEDEYKYQSDLYGDVAIAMEECVAFIKGKHAPAPQLEIQFNTPEPQGSGAE